ncbi:hypothetical protein M408DRAFT_325860 [Serendipita vermifera MAFF 305830]|uniref:Uncharacterized protein n=1 Tax=Serendipita vermifera MAFF 305830 TaxID=933852 RepID=A0A0C2X8U2_SERVB|nr:hypothetical protein M408DRAFT_325860 [Serendipita vermifera MAFF 305830]
MGKLKRALRWLAKLSKHYPQKAPSKSVVLRSQIEKLPIELLEHIFALAASDPTLRALTLNLARVAKWTNAIVLPLLYQTVHLHTDKQAQRFLNTITYRPDLCRFIVVFDSPQVNIFKRAWPKRHAADLCLPYVAALNRTAPHLRTLAKIFPILFLEEPTDETSSKPLETDVKETGEIAETEGEEAQTVVSTTSKAPILQSVAIHALTLCPPFDVNAETAGLARMMQLPSDVTLSGFGTSSIVRWNFSKVERLRFTSVVNGGTLRTEELLLVPNLTHLALPLWRNTFETTKQLLAAPNLIRLVLFVLFDPIDDETMAKATAEAAEANADGPINNNADSAGTESTAQTNGIITESAGTTTTLAAAAALNQNNPTDASSADPNASSASLRAVYSESAALRSIDDPRLILFNIREMVTLCRVPSHRFWDEVELRARHIAAHVVLGKLRSMAGNSLADV